MTINEYVKEIDFPEMELLGEMKNFRYYIQKEDSPEEDLGIPLMIEENISKNSFVVIAGERVLNLLAYFKEKDHGTS